MLWRWWRRDKHGPRAPDEMKVDMGKGIVPVVQSDKIVWPMSARFSDLESMSSVSTCSTFSEPEVSYVHAYADGHNAEMKEILPERIKQQNTSDGLDDWGLPLGISLCNEDNRSRQFVSEDVHKLLAVLYCISIIRPKVSYEGQSLLLFLLRCCHEVSKQRLNSRAMENSSEPALNFHLWAF
ncbi:hypothetical protein CANCADRAFT_124223 [Tortispora caseinolytica NRRL Y-17796]|uniref:Uncharacterized protein n=1 Tax=Tortispora caseinolytica NRRL Y-17796 TaxID=767744 RepID=A0A1E4T9X8_9ASCO|nr:hypothetical protein CANCADRAFT_124223 [Tortispora caseinolytica NRRL Y-17796]